MDAGRRLGRYRLEEKIGAGGMAEVFRAHDEVLDRQVAVKVIAPALAADDAFRRRFLREARTVAALEHPAILPIYDCGEQDGRTFLVMPLVRGGTLADRLGHGPLPLERVTAWVGQLAGALDAAHRAGVLHRDVKPGNVLVADDGRLYLADFGIARLADATTRLTGTGTVVGTPVYMAPEVAAGETSTPASDLYALAVMAYELLAGRPPFEGENVLSILHQHATRPVPPVTSAARDLPAGLDDTLALALAKDPASRPTPCARFAQALAAQLPPERRPAAATPAEDPTLPLPATVARTTLGPRETPPEATPPDAAPTVPTSAEYGIAGRLRGLAAAAGVGALVALAVLVAWQRLGPARPSAPPVSASPPPAPSTSEPIENGPADSQPGESQPGESQPGESQPGEAPTAEPPASPTPPPAERLQELRDRASRASPEDLARARELVDEALAGASDLELPALLDRFVATGLAAGREDAAALFLRVAGELRRQGRVADVRRLLQAACDAGAEPACRRLRQLEKRSGPRRRTANRQSRPDRSL